MGAGIVWTVHEVANGWAATAPECPRKPHRGGCRCGLFVTEAAANQYADALAEADA